MWEEHVTLRDGRPAVIRPFDPEHPLPREILVDAYDHLSDETKFHRFLSAVPYLTESLLTHLIDDVDGVHHVALIISLEPEQGPESMVGIGRMIRYPDREDVADVAVTIRDEWHGHGCATALLDSLVRHRPKGVTTIDTMVAADNAASLAMLQRLGECHLSPISVFAINVTIDLPELDEPLTAPKGLLVGEPPQLGDAEPHDEPRDRRSQRSKRHVRVPRAARQEADDREQPERPERHPRHQVGDRAAAGGQEERERGQDQR